MEGLSWLPLTCYIPLEPPGLGSVVVGRGSLREQANGFSKPLQGCVEVPGFCCPHSLQLQGLGVFQLCLRENSICTREETRQDTWTVGKKTESHLGLWHYDTRMSQPGVGHSKVDLQSQG